MGKPPPIQELRALAKKAQAMAYAPYSGYPVGASLLTVGGELWGGCGNVENSNYTLTKHGEETAVLAALQGGVREREDDKFIQAIYLTTVAGAACLPCGGCRQFVQEFAAPTGFWLIEQADGGAISYPFREFLPFP